MKSLLEFYHDNKVLFNEVIVNGYEEVYKDFEISKMSYISSFDVILISIMTNKTEYMITIKELSRMAKGNNLRMEIEDMRTLDGKLVTFNDENFIDKLDEVMIEL